MIEKQFETWSDVFIRDDEKLIREKTKFILRDAHVNGLKNPALVGHFCGLPALNRSPDLFVDVSAPLVPLDVRF